MSNQKKQLTFKGQKVYIGIDVHKKSWTVTILFNGMEHKTFNQAPEPTLLYRYLHRHFPGADLLCVYEAGFCGFGPQRKLEELGADCIVVNPADVPTTDKEKKRKDDRSDSRKLARGLQAGELKGIYIPSIHMVEYRGLVRTRSRLVKDQTRTKNRLKSYLYNQGISIPEQFSKTSHWSGAFIGWIRSLTMQTESGKATLEAILEEGLAIRKLILATTRQMRTLSKHPDFNERIGWLTSLPGIGLISAMTLATELVDINRFGSLDKLCSFVGLIPNCHSSGENQRTGRITNRGNHFLKNVLIEGAWTAIKKDPMLMLEYQRLTKHMVGNKAIIRIARKLLNRVRYVLKNETTYSVETQAA